MHISLFTQQYSSCTYDTSINITVRSDIFVSVSALLRGLTLQLELPGKVDEKSGICYSDGCHKLSFLLFFMFVKKYKSIYFCCHCPVVILITTVTTDDRRLARCAACAPAPRVSLAIRCTASSTPSFRGVCRTPATVITTGLDCTADWTGMDSSAPPSPILSQWENRSDSRKVFIT